MCIRDSVIGVYGLVLVAVDYCRLVACKVVFVLGCMVKLVGFLDPVSYTHLDVYKRQK